MARKVASGMGVPSRDGAFSLMEVMIAIGIFFVAVFAILELTSQHLRTARMLQRLDVDMETFPALLTLTNYLEPGPLPIEITALYEDLHPGLKVEGMVSEFTTNGLLQVDYAVRWKDQEIMKEARNTILLWRPAYLGNPRFR